VNQLTQKRHQIEAFDDLSNPYIDPADLTRGTGDKYVGSIPREKVQVPQAAWDRAGRDMNGTERMTTTATTEELQAYQYRLARAGHALEKQRKILTIEELQPLYQVRAEPT
jgi:hypothetical protein